MEVSYNPQCGKRRSLFSSKHDFLLKIKSLYEKQNALHILSDTFAGNNMHIRISFPELATFRFEMWEGECKEDISRPIDDELKLEETRLSELEDRYVFGTDLVQIHLKKAFWEMSVYSHERLISQEQVLDTNVDNRWKVLPTGLDFDEDGRPQAARATFSLYTDEAFYGFGDSFTELDKRGRKFEIWQRDALSTNSEHSYKGQPFFISSRGFAIFLNTYTRSHFDMGMSSQLSWQMASEDGTMDYLFFVAVSDNPYKELVRRYTAYFGQIPSVPEWAFGYWQSKCSYQTQEEVEQVVREAKANGILLDLIHIDNWQEIPNQGLWIWDKERFPNPQAMIRFLHERNVRLSLWIFPYVSERSPYFEHFAAKKYFVMSTSEQGPARFKATADAKDLVACFDFTNPEVRTWYSEKVKEIIGLGVDVIKNDFSEAVPEDVLFFDGSSGVQSHNRLPYLYAKTIYDAMADACHGTGRVPMLWSRSGYAGQQTIPAVWAGDSGVLAADHAALLHSGLSLALCGVCFWGFDLGGFYYTAPTGDEHLPPEEDYLQSMILGLAMPLSRAHGKSAREPWKYSSRVLESVQKYNNLRHALRPYLYGLSLLAKRDSIPLLRPLFMEYPHDIQARHETLSYMLGDCFLIAPAFDREKYAVYLPKGTWFEAKTKQRIKGGCYVEVEKEAGTLAIWIRGNSAFLMRKKGKLYLEIFDAGNVNQEILTCDEAGNICSHSVCVIDSGGKVSVETDLTFDELERFS